MADFQFVNKPWTHAKLMSMTTGASMPDEESGDGGRDIPCSSWYMLRCQAYDNGNVDLMDDVIQFEWAVNNIPDPKCRAAVILAMFGWDYADIGAAIGGHRPGVKLVEQGVNMMAKSERRRSE